MKKMYIVVRSKYSTRRICTEDLSKMHYFVKRCTPRLPTYNEGEDAFGLVSSQYLCNEIITS